MWGIFCNNLSQRQVHKNRVRDHRIIMVEKESQLKRRKAGQVNKRDRASQQKWQKEGKPNKIGNGALHPGSN